LTKVFVDHDDALVLIDHSERHGLGLGRCRSNLGDDDGESLTGFDPPGGLQDFPAVRGQVPGLDQPFQPAARKRRQPVGQQPVDPPAGLFRRRGNFVAFRARFGHHRSSLDPSQ
jgi:hypothetical protein